jgi:hypothetical protein|tara:strand:- start:534 stop:767 length:234 start_codon:yes stop_codon:yes gene_type:complete
MVTKEQIEKLIEQYADSCEEHAWFYYGRFENFAEDLMILVDQEITASYKLIEDLTVELQKSNDAGIEMSKVICKALP